MAPPFLCGGYRKPRFYHWEWSYRIVLDLNIPGWDFILFLLTTQSGNPANNGSQRIVFGVQRGLLHVYKFYYFYQPLLVVLWDTRQRDHLPENIGRVVKLHSSIIQAVGQITKCNNLVVSVVMWSTRCYNECRPRRSNINIKRLINIGAPLMAIAFCTNEATMTFGIIATAVWFVYACSWFWLWVFRFLQFQSIPTQFRMFQALCQEKKRRDEYENLMLLQKIEELHSAVASAQSRDKTSSWLHLMGCFASLACVTLYRKNY